MRSYQFGWLSVSGLTAGMVSREMGLISHKYGLFCTICTLIWTGKKKAQKKKTIKIASLRFYLVCFIFINHIFSQ